MKGTGETYNDYLLTGEVWPGAIPKTWILMHPVVDKDAPLKALEFAYSPSTIELVAEAMRACDAYLTEVAIQRHPDELVQVAGVADEGNSQQSFAAVLGVSSTVDRLLRDHQNTHLVSLMSGAGLLHNFIANLNYSDGELRSRLHSTKMVGYADTGRTVPIMVHDVTSEILQAHYTIIGDDGIDSAHTLAAFVNALALARDSADIDFELVARLSEIKNERFFRYRTEYDSLVVHMFNEGVLIAAPFYKNIPFLQALVGFCKSFNDSGYWARAQLALLRSALVFDETSWCIGRGFDFGAYGEKIVTRIRNEWSGHMPQYAEDVLFDLERSVIRVGAGVDCVAVVRGNDGEALIDIAAYFLHEALIKKCQELAIID